MVPTERRVYFRKGLHPLYLPIYDGLCGLLGLEWAPYFGNRTVEEENALYAKGRTLPGKIVTWARGGESPHNFGCATDWAYFENGNLVWLPAEDPKWNEFGQAVEKAGGGWGGCWTGRKDIDHCQLDLKVPWKAVRPILVAKGMDEAIRFIAGNVA